MSTAFAQTPAAAASAPSAQASITQLADVAVPAPVSWMPQTIGWQVLGVLAVVAALVVAWRMARRYLRNRYRREALAEMHALEQRWQSGSVSAANLLTALPPLLKRCALAACPREQVAGLSGQRWVDFLQARAGSAQSSIRQLGPLLSELEYRDANALAKLDAQQLRAVLDASRQWIVGHVSA